MSFGVGRCLREHRCRSCLQERTPAGRHGFDLIGLFGLLFSPLVTLAIDLIIGLAVSLTFDQTGTVVRSAT